MYDITLRRLKDRIATPICHLIPQPITPNILTLLAFILGLLSCFTAAFSSTPSPPPPPLHNQPLTFWLLNRLFDGLDGSLARERNSASELGGFLDLLSDFLIYSLLPLAIVHGQSILTPSLVDWRAVAVLEASFHVNNFVLFYIAAVAAKRDEGELTSVTMRPALVEGFESGLLFTAMLIWPRYISVWSWGMSAAVAVSTVQRVIFLLPVLSGLKQSGKGKDS
ncbi:MAG: hypothetical protein M1835_003443 [Candelina submexicana]|nr:MAG: hypothetical protein M1835_003443 [Candelina submexicana]